MKPLAERPKVADHLADVWRAFYALRPEAGPISFLAIDAYARRYGIDGIDAFERFAAMIDALDAEYRKPKPTET